MIIRDSAGVCNKQQERCACPNLNMGFNSWNLSAKILKALKSDTGCEYKENLINAFIQIRDIVQGLTVRQTITGRGHWMT